MSDVDKDTVTLFCCGNMMREKRQDTPMIKQELRVGANGSLQLPPEVLKEMGISPGSKVLVNNSLQGLTIRNLNPDLSKLYIEPTNTCNLNCRTCIRRSWNNSEGFMDMDIYTKILKDVRHVTSLKKISFWGFGEPLLHPHIVEMVSKAKKLGVETQLITNGLLLNKKMAHDLIVAGLDSLVVSIDGTTREMQAEIRSGADLNIVKNNIKQLRIMRDSNLLTKPEIGIEFVIMRSNVKDIAHLKEVAYELGANSIYITNVLPYCEELKDDILYWESVRMKTMDKGIVSMPKVSFPPIDNTNDVAENLIKISGSLDLSNNRLDRQNGYCRFVGEGALVVSWEGEVSPCMALIRSYTCFILGRKKEIKKYIIGNVSSETMIELWERPDFAQFREKVQRFDFAPCTYCGGCDMAESNEEDCYDNTFPVCGDCLWAQGVIQCP